MCLVCGDHGDTEVDLDDILDESEDDQDYSTVRLRDGANPPAKGRKVSRLSSRFM